MAAFFEVDTLGDLRFGAPPARLLGLSAYPYLPAVLEQLAGRGVRLGIICREPSVNAVDLTAALAAAGISASFDHDLLFLTTDALEVEPGSSRSIALPSGRASSRRPSSCLLVSEDSLARGQALAAGWRAAPHPLLAPAVLDGDALWFARITVPPRRAAARWRATLRGLALVSLRLSAATAAETVLAIASETALAELANAQFDVERSARRTTPRRPTCT